MKNQRDFARASLEVHGHRGCRGLRPENTLPAFLHALELGVDVVELDVVISADQEVVVSHEPWLSAALCRGAEGQLIAPAAERDFNLYQLSYAYIRRCDCGQMPQTRFPEQHTQAAFKPLLRDVIQAIEARTRQLGRVPVRYSIEVKSSLEGDNLFHPTPARFVALVLAVANAAAILPRTTLLSFDKRALQEARQQLPNLPLCLLVEDTKPLRQHLQELGFAPTVYGPEYPLVDAQLVEEVRSYAMRLVPWTVNEPASMQALIELEVDGITTDYPDRLLRLLRRM